MTKHTCPHCGHTFKTAKKVRKQPALARDMKLMSENGRTLKSVSNHYGQDSYGFKATMNHGYEKIRKHFTHGPITRLTPSR